MLPKGKAATPQPAAATGSIQLITELTGKFYIDGVFYQEVKAGSTYTFNNIQTGIRIINITGSVNWTEKLMVFAGQPTVIRAKEELVVTIADVRTESTSNIQQTTATVAGNVANDGGARVTERGIVYSSSRNPTTSNSKVSAGSGTGSFTANLTGLRENTTYNVRAYAINEKGTAYGEEKSFSTVASRTSATASSASTTSGTNYTETIADLNLDMVFIQGGTFTMGCTPDGDSDCDDDEKPPHSVTLSNFYMGKTEVTNAQYCAFLNEKGNQTEGGVEWINLSGSYEGEKCRISKSGSSFYVQSGYDNYPVIYVSWYGAKAFCDWVSSKTGKNYRLPTEAQWEYAARSKGKEYKYAWGNGNPTKSKGGNICDETAKSKFSNCN